MIDEERLKFVAQTVQRTLQERERCIVMMFEEGDITGGVQFIATVPPEITRRIIIDAAKSLRKPKGRLTRRN